MEEETDWTASIQRELASMRKMGVFDVVPTLPAGQKVIGSMFVHTLKKGIRKSRLVALGNQQLPDECDNYAPTINGNTLRLMLALGAQKGYALESHDVASAFLNSPLKEDVYMSAPKAMGLRMGSILKVIRAIYGLRQASKAWHLLISAVLLEQGFVRSKIDECLFFRKVGSKVVFIGLHVDDILLLSNDESEMKSVLDVLYGRFKMTGGADPETYLGLQIKRDKDGITIHQQQYIESLLDDFGLMNCNPVSTPWTERHSRDSQRRKRWTVVSCVV